MLSAYDTGDSAAASLDIIWEHGSADIGHIISITLRVIHSTYRHHHSCRERDTEELLRTL